MQYPCSSPPLVISSCHPTMQSHSLELNLCNVLSLRWAYECASWNRSHGWVLELLLSDADSSKIQQLLAHLEVSDSITAVLQDRATTLHRARVMFDGVHKSCPEMKPHIGANVHIIDFENAFVKIPSNLDIRIIKAKERTGHHLLKPTPADRVSARVGTSTLTESRSSEGSSPRRWIPAQRQESLKTYWLTVRAFFVQQMWKAPFYSRIRPQRSTQGHRASENWDAAIS